MTISAKEIATWHKLYDETQEALQRIGGEFGVLAGEERTSGIRRVLTEQRSRIAALEAQLAEAVAALAMSDQPCAYCSLPADDFAKCEHGFPGCSRADDALGCPHLGDALEAGELRSKIASLESERDQLRKRVEVLKEVLTKLRLTSALLYQNAEGCAANHYGHDIELNGLPGWLKDCKSDLDLATAILSAASALEQKEQG